MINYYVDEFGTLRIYKGTQCLAYISQCENSTTQEIQNLVDEVIIELGYSQYLGEEAKYDDSLESLFESISRAIESTVQICISEYSSLTWRLFDFGCEAMDLIKPCLCNQKAFNMVDMILEVHYWIDAYKDRYSEKELVRECCQSIVFNLFCIIDGVSSNNDFKIEKTVFDETLQDAEFHSLWCKYLTKSNKENKKINE